MGRPSIFSSNYDKLMKRRRRNIIGGIVCALLSAGIILVLAIDFGIIKVDFLNITEVNAKNKDEGAPKEEVKPDGDDNEDKSSDKNNDIKVEPQQKQSFVINLGSGIAVNAEYEEQNGEKKFTVVEGLTDGSTFDINKSQTSVVINDNTSQEIKLYDINGTEKDLTKKSYVTKAGKSFNKDTIMNQYPGYRWSSNARFIDDTHIAYLSQLPWFGTNQKNIYVWVIDTNTGNHTTVWNAFGKSVEFGNINENGIEVIIDGVTKTVNIQGNCV